MYQRHGSCAELIQPLGMYVLLVSTYSPRNRYGAFGRTAAERSATICTTKRPLLLQPRSLVKDVKIRGRYAAGTFWVCGSTRLGAHNMR